MYILNSAEEPRQALAERPDAPYDIAMGTLDVFIRILVAAVLGGAIGLEREIREHTAGFRTHILVSVGAGAFTLASSYGLEGTGFDPNRISAQVVTGIGFLGAGAIIRYGASVRGLTTAASLWAVAAVGLLTAQGFYPAALITTAVVILSLYVLRLIEDRFLYPHTGTPLRLRIRFRVTGYAPLAEVMAALDQVHVAVKELVGSTEPGEAALVHLSLKLPRGVTPAVVTALVADLPQVESVAVE
jgi:putative Mg2+ transporter-C (MgtC) family protein